MVIIVTKLVTLVTASLKVSNVLNHVHVRVRIVLISVVKSAIRIVLVSPLNNVGLLYFFHVRAKDDDKRFPANGTNKCWTTRGAKIKNRVDLIKELLSTLNVMENVLSKKEIEKLQKL